MLKKIPFVPGIDKEGTQYTASFGWFDCDKIRFRKGRVEQIGGWVKYTDESYKGVARSLFDWATAAANKYLGIGTNLKFYVEQGGSLYDVTPIRMTTAASAITFAKVADGDATLTVTDSTLGGHGATLGDYVTYTNAIGLGGNITAAHLNQEYKISSIGTTSTYEIEAKDTNGDPVLAAAGDTGDGLGATSGAYQVNVGTNWYIPATGWGSGNWDEGVWGGGTDITFANQLRLYSQDVFGDDLLFNPRGGGIYYWDESNGTGVRGVDITDSTVFPSTSNAPTAALQVMVSQIDRHVIAFGASPLGSTPAVPIAIDPLLIRWADQESALDWTPTATNSAGGQVLSTGTKIIGGIKTRQEILVFTDTSIHSMQFAGSPFVFQFSVIAENVTSLSPKAMISVGDAVYFMDLEGFYVYQGSINRLPCDVLNYVYDEIDRTQLYKIYATNNPDDSEVTWFYPVPGDLDVSKYVTYNYAENVWTIGTFDRAAWIQAASRTYPIASTADLVDVEENYLYNQEYLYNAEGQEIAGYIESGEIEISDGEQFSFLKRIISDFRIAGSRDNALWTLIIKGSDFPLEYEDLPILYTKEVTATTKQSHVRVRARAIVLRIESSGIDYGWTMGDFRFGMRTDGRR